MTRALRLVAVAIALAALVDPGVSMRRRQPLPIDVRIGASPSDPDGTRAARVREAVIHRLGSAIVPDARRPRAVIAIGGGLRPGEVADGVPISVISVEPAGRNVRIVEAKTTALVTAGRPAVVAVTLQGDAAGGERSVVVLEQDGLEIARAAHAWSADDERGAVQLTYAPAEPGLSVLRVRALPVRGETTEADNVADVAVRVVARAWRVLTWAPRPSWTVAFVRRALEADSAFDVSALTRSSRGLETRSGTAPARLTADALAPFDIVIAGAPEELDRREVEALDTFVRDRGGAVVFLPDRPPSGAYRSLLPPTRFDEMLLAEATSLTAADGAGFRASEFALPSGTPVRGAAVATVPQGGQARPAVVSWTRGAGLVVYSGALDAWRFRGDAGGGFTSFWTAIVAELAVQSPPPLSASVDPPYAAPGDRLTVRARYRATELERAGETTRVPAVRADIVSADGRATALRLWPGAAGEYEGSIEAPAAGRYDVRVSSEAGAVADVPLVVAAGARTRRLVPAPAWLAQPSGGLAVHVSDTHDVEAAIRALPRPAELVQVYPMRSGWWILPFAGALCGEWALRRRKGLR